MKKKARGALVQNALSASKNLGKHKKGLLQGSFMVDAGGKKKVKGEELLLGDFIPEVAEAVPQPRREP